MRPGTIPEALSDLDYLALTVHILVSLKSSVTSRGNMMIFWPRSRVSSVILASETTGFTPCSISSHLPVTGEYQTLTFLVCIG